MEKYRCETVGNVTEENCAIFAQNSHGNINFMYSEKNKKVFLSDVSIRSG